MKYLIIVALILSFAIMLKSTTEQTTTSEYFEIYAPDDIFYIEKHPDYKNWYSIHSEKFGELVQGCNAETAMRFLHDNSYRAVTDRYKYNYQAIEN